MWEWMGSDSTISSTGSGRYMGQQVPLVALTNVNIIKWFCSLHVSLLAYSSQCKRHIPLLHFLSEMITWIWMRYSQRELIMHPFLWRMYSCQALICGLKPPRKHLQSLLYPKWVKTSCDISRMGHRWALEIFYFIPHCKILLYKSPQCCS